MFTLYGALAALSLAALLAVSCLALRKNGAGYDAFIRFAVCCIPLALIGSRLAFCLSNLPYYLETIAMPEMMLHLWDGGASLSGALAGVLIAAMIAARWSKLPAGTVLDAAAYGMPLALLIERLAEPLCEMGWGKYFQSGVFAPLAEWTGDMHPVFAYEALAAALIALAMLRFARRPHRPGDGMGAFLVLYGCTQTVLESLRNDGHMKVIHFVRVNQVAAIALAVTVLVIWGLRCCRAGGKKEAVASFVATAVCIGFGVVQEFAADGDENPYFSLTLVSGLLAAALLAVCFAWFFVWRRSGAKHTVVLPGCAALAAALLLIERTLNTGDQRLFFVYGIMAVNLFIIGYMAFALRRHAAHLTK